jgi:hypothetical protein
MDKALKPSDSECRKLIKSQAVYILEAQLMASHGTSTVRSNVTDL